MTDHPGNAINRNVERCQEREGVAEDDAEAILDAHRQMELLGASRLSQSHHSDVLMRSVKMARDVGGLADALTERKAAEEIVRWIHRNYENEETNRDYRKCLRAFGRHATGSDDPPDSIAWGPRATRIRTTRRPIPARCSTGTHT